MEPTIAFLSRGRLFVKRPGEEPREIESAFAKDALQRQRKSQDMDAWKGRSGVWGNMGMAPPQWSQWEQEGRARRQITFASIARGKNTNELLYVLDLESVSGLFQYDLLANVERRLVHRNNFEARDLACDASEGTLAISLRREDGTATLAFSDSEGRHWNSVSGGDSVDQAPAWVRGSRRVVYQSAPVGRSPAGFVMGLGPYAIETLELDGDGEVKRLLAGTEIDYLLPRMTSGGTLYCIRRPYKPQARHQASAWETLQDLAMFPFRLLLAIFHFLNFFSVMFAGQPLATSVGPRPAAQEDRFLMLWGHMIDTRQAMAKASNEKSAALVPKNWELVRRDENGKETVVAQNVLAYDLTDDGEVVLTNGAELIYVDRDGNKRRLCNEAMVQAVVALG